MQAKVHALGKRKTGEPPESSYRKEATLASRKTWSNKTRSKGSQQKSEMEWVIKALFPEYVKEFKFSDRRFKFDYYIPGLKLGIEYEGIMVEKEEVSDHTSRVGYTSNCEKYNLAQILGYKVLRYTVLNYKDLGRDLQELLNQPK